MQRFRANFLPYKSLTVASIKMYFRNRTAVFFSLFLPLMFILIFGAFNTTGTSKINLEVANNAHTDLANTFVHVLTSNNVFKVTNASEAAGKTALNKSNADLVVVIPSGFGVVDSQTHGLTPATIKTYYNKGQPQTGESASLIIGQIASTFNDQVTKTPQVFTVTSAGVSTTNLGYLDYLVPGILALSIMQLGITSIAFAFVTFKTSGALRRLHVTPTNPLAFIFGQSVARLLITIMQVLLLLGISVAAFHIKIVGSVPLLLFFAVLGSLVFLAFGFAVAGWAKDENQAAPVANLITFPMLFLSGTFFSRDGLPHWLQTITGFLPLTYLSDAMRSVSTQGATLYDERGQVLGLIVWGIIAFFIAVKVFKWE